MANGLYAGSPQQYYGIKRRIPSYDPIIQSQSGLSMYALKEIEEKETAEQTRHEEEMSLAKANIEQAQKELASFEKYQIAGMDLSKESMTLQESISKYQTDVQKSIARRESEQRAAEAKKAQLVSGLQTGVQAAQVGSQIYQAGKGAGWWGGGAGAETGAGAGAGTGVVAGAGAGMAAGGAYGSGSLGYGGVALGSSTAASGAAGGAAGAGVATGAVAGPLAGAVMLSQTHRPFEWAIKHTLGGHKSYTPKEWEEYVNWIQSGGRAAQEAAAPLMPYNALKRFKERRDINGL